ncbi:hypothetical protein ACFLRF_06195 [Candidatus Altiarchaeota archaeon]
MRCHDCPHGSRFMLSILGVMASFTLIIIGLIPVINRIQLRLPVVWLIAIMIAFPSLILYYQVKEDFWKEVMSKSE